jgi:DNA-binding response OmpR family regulator
MILDISMPGMDGFETLSLIRKNPATANLRVLMLTSNKHVNDVIKATQYGVSDYIIKPSVREEILKRVERALERW